MSSFGEGHSLFETCYKIYSCVINRGILSRGSPHVTAEKKGGAECEFTAKVWNIGIGLYFPC